MIDIQKLTPQWESWFYETDERRLDSEEVTVKLGRSGFALEYRPKPGALWRVTSREEAPAHAEAVGEGYVAFLDGEPAGRMTLRAGEYRPAQVEGLSVSLALRRRGVGRALLDYAAQWAARYGLCGLCVETQDTNAGACQFLTRCGFALGGVDMLRYVCQSVPMRKAPALREKALFFYKLL